MKKRINKFIKLGIFLFGISLLIWNCENEKIALEEQLNETSIEQKLEHTNFDNFLKDPVFKEFNTKYNLNIYAETKDLKKSNDINISIDVNAVNKISYGNSVSYNFYINRNSNNSSSIENLVVIKTKDMTSAFIVEYSSSKNYGRSTSSAMEVEFDQVEVKPFSDDQDYQLQEFLKSHQMSGSSSSCRLFTFTEYLNCSSKKGHTYDKIADCMCGWKDLTCRPPYKREVSVRICDPNNNINVGNSNQNSGSDSNGIGGSGNGGNSLNEYDAVTVLTTPNELIINKLTNECGKNIFNELENGIYQNDPIKPEVEILAINTGTLNFSEEILHLFASSKETNFTIKNGNLIGRNALTDPLTNTTTLNNSYLNNATELSIARTMIHEQVHAYINSFLKSKPGFLNMDLQRRMREYARDKGIIDTYKFHHEFMGQYINGIALSLYEWDKDYGNGKGLNNITKPDDLLGWNYYRAMAWGGLFQTNPNTGLISSLTDSFQELVPNEIDRQKIADIVINELKNNNDAKGTKCN